MMQLTWSNTEIGVVKPVKFGWSDAVKSDNYKGEIPLSGMKVSGRMLVSIAKAYAALDHSIFEQLGYKVDSK